MIFFSYKFSGVLNNENYSLSLSNLKNNIKLLNIVPF